MYRIVLARFYLYRECRQFLIVIDQKVYFTIMLIVIIIEGMSMRSEFLRDSRFVNSSKIDSNRII